MSFSKSPNWHFQANEMLRKLMSRYDENYGLGSMSSSIYDTAWVSMISKPVNGQLEWAFPECFQVICNNQLDDGGWAGYGSFIDQITNSLASLLSLAKHQATPLWPGNESEIKDRITRATEFLKAKLLAWDVLSTQHVGFEVLIPAMLELLEKENITFEFPEKGILLKLNQEKLKEFLPAVVYSRKTTVLHSLEGFIGKLDFDRLEHHKVNGSLMASPSSTAAYLMNCSIWDEESEEYIRHVIQNCHPYGEGFVPAAFPTTLFEISWVICNLFENGFKVDEIDENCLRKIVSMLTKALVEENGVIGFAPNVGSDVDDTAKAIVALNLVFGSPFPGLDALVQKYESDDHFQTYECERNPSFTANCNVLIALLHAADPEIYASQVEKCIQFLCNEWWRADGKLDDKWNISPYYPSMLLSQALVRFLNIWGKGYFSNIPDNLMREKIPVTLFQVLLRTLQSQSSDGDGSWGRKKYREETAYSLITLANLSSLPFVAPLGPQIDAAISLGRDFLRHNGGARVPHLTSMEYLWIEKVTYASENLHHSYVLGALNVPVPTYKLGSKVENLVNIPRRKVEEFIKFYSQTPLFSSTPKWQIRASLMEGFLFLPELSRVKLYVFDRKGFGEDKYVEYIPFTWTGPNNQDQTYAGAQMLFDMMVLSLLNYQVDEYIEAIVGITYAHALEDVKRMVENIFAEIELNSDQRPTLNGNRKRNGTVLNEMKDAYQKLSTFVKFILDHPRIQNSSVYDKNILKKEIKTYLLAQIGQGEDNLRLRAQKSKKEFDTPRSSYLKWVRGIASDHLSCHFAFAYMTCLLSIGEDYYPTIEVNYVARDCCTHIATLCRMYNDYGSVARDRDEANLNSLNFPEFKGGEGKADAELKKELMRVVGYERKCLELSLKELEALCGDRNRRVFRMVKLYSNVADLYNQIYFSTDITCRV